MKILISSLIYLMLLVPYLAHSENKVFLFSNDQNNIEGIKAQAINNLHEECNISTLEYMAELKINPNSDEDLDKSGNLETVGWYGRALGTQHRLTSETLTGVHAILVSFRHPDIKQEEKGKEFILNDIIINGQGYINETQVLVEQDDDTDDNGNKAREWSHNSVLICFDQSQDISEVIVDGYSNYRKGRTVRILPISAFSQALPEQQIQ